MADAGAAEKGRGRGEKKKSQKSRAASVSAENLPRSGPRGTSPVKAAAAAPKRGGYGVTVVVGGAKAAEGGGLLELFCNGQVPEKPRGKKGRQADVDDEFEPRTVGVDVPPESREADDPSQLSLSLALCSSPADVGGLSAADCIALCYTPANASSLEEARTEWMPAIRSAAPKAAVLLCATRIELLQKGRVERLIRQAKERGGKFREVTPMDGAKAAAQLQLNGYSEASTKNNKGVKNAILRAALLGARARRLGRPPESYTAGGKEQEQELQAVREYVKLSPFKPRWEQRRRENGMVMYFDTKHRKMQSKKPAGFDGDDWVAKEEEAERQHAAAVDSSFEQLQEDRARAEVLIVWAHERRCAELHVSALELQEEVCGQECRAAELYQSQQKLAEDRADLERRLERLEAELSSERQRGEEQQMAGREREADLEAREQRSEAVAERLVADTFDSAQLQQLERYHAEQKQKRDDAVAARERAAQELRALKGQEAALLEAARHTEGMTAVGTAAREASAEQAKRAEAAVEALAGRRRRLQTEASRVSAEEAEARLAAEHRATEHQRLQAEVKRLDLYILHTQRRAQPTGDAEQQRLRADLMRLQAAGRRACADTAVAAAVAQTAGEALAEARRGAAAAAAAASDAYDESFRLLHRGCDLLAAVAAVHRHRRLRLHAARQLRRRRGQPCGTECAEQHAGAREEAAEAELRHLRRLLQTRHADHRALSEALIQGTEKCDALLRGMAGHPTGTAASPAGLRSPVPSGLHQMAVDAAGRHSDGCSTQTRRAMAEAEMRALDVLRRLLPPPPPTLPHADVSRPPDCRAEQPASGVPRAPEELAAAVRRLRRTDPCIDRHLTALRLPSQR